MLNSRVLFFVPILTLGCGALSSTHDDGRTVLEDKDEIAVPDGMEVSPPNSTPHQHHSLASARFFQTPYTANLSISAESFAPDSGPDSEELYRAAALPDLQSEADDCSGVVDECPVAGGVTWQCKKRYVHGVNYAWHTYSGDFGGIPAWGQAGVATTAAAVDKELQDMKANGANVVRWWVLPDFRSAGVSFDDSDTPTGLGPTFQKDLLKALELAEKNDIYLMMNIFSFDTFRPTRTEAGVKIRGLRPILLDPKKRHALLEKVIRPMARIAEKSPHRKRLMTWDMFNEPEWAMTGPGQYGDPAYECDSRTLECVTHEQMESFLADTARVLRSESKALISVGGAAIKWKNAWSRLDLDYLQFHFYDWVNLYYPYTKSPKDWGLTDKPVVMGEYPFHGVPGADASKLMASWYASGFGGSLGWAVTDSAYNWSSNRVMFKDFTNRNSCQMRF